MSASSRLDDLAVVRLVVCPDTELLDRLIHDAGQNVQQASGVLRDELQSWLRDARELVRTPMRLEVSSDGGETWGELPTTDGVKFTCSKNGWPTVDVSVLVAGGFGDIVPVKLPPMPGDDAGSSE